MSKTAEEILVEHRVFMTTDTIKTFNLNVTRDCGIGTSKWIMNSMREFAAQEVEEYKKRLREKVGALLETGGKGPVHPQFHNGVAESYKLIEAVK